MKTLRIIFIPLFALVISIGNTEIKAQEAIPSSTSNSGYTTGIGLRLGYESGFTIKHFIKQNRALEGIISRGWGYGGMRITGLYEIQRNISSAQGLSWFYGIGGHVGSFNGNYYGYTNYNGGYYDKHGKFHPTYQERYYTVGIDLILGLEYKFVEVPFTVGLDIKPYFDFIGRGDHFGDGAFSVRYAF